MEQPLSENLVQALAPLDAGERITVNDLLLRTRGRGYYLVMVLLSLPFLTPIPIGLSLPFGLIIAALSGQLLARNSLVLPSRLGNRDIPASVRHLILGGGVRSLRWIERWIHPRRSPWMGWPTVQAFHAGLLILLALLLALPLPIPLTNTLPALAIILIAVSMMEEDGRAIFAGYFMTLVTLGYFAFWAGAIGTVIMRAYEFVLRLVGGGG